MSSSAHAQNRQQRMNELCRQALIAALQTSSAVTTDAKGYVSAPAENLIEGVCLEDFEADLLQGHGNELSGKFQAAHSSSALAVNTFAPFKAKPEDLWLPCGSGFREVQFERHCPHGLVNRRAPNLDVLLTCPEGVVAIESKCLEPLTPHRAVFAPAYSSQLIAMRPATWFTEMQRLISRPDRYRWLDAAQLVKHAFGLTYSFPGRPTTLVYLYWEPTNAKDYRVFQEHRAEIDQFAQSVSGTGPAFFHMSYPDLWRFWSDVYQPAWLPAHIRRLRSRYEIFLN